jgi:hypothetical protein
MNCPAKGCLVVIRNADKCGHGIWYPNLVGIHALGLSRGSVHFLVGRIGYKEDSHYVDPSLIKEGYDETTPGQVSLTKLVQPISM